MIERDVSPERLERFFLKEDVTYRVRSSVREMCVRSRITACCVTSTVLQDAPDLVP